MSTFQETNLWIRTLAPNVTDSPSTRGARAHFRDIYISMRQRALPIAERIAADLPEFTVHDITHLDALWEVADLIIGPDYLVTPVEAFLLGAAFLIHDLGLGLAAYPDGIEAVKKETVWQDQVALRLRSRLMRAPSPSEIRSADHEIL